MNDTVLIRKVLSGDREAFGDLVDQYERLVYGIVLEKTRRPDVVEDLSQEVFCKAYTDLFTLRKMERFGPWLGQIAVNTALNWLRQNNVRLKAALEIEQTSASSNLNSPDRESEHKEAVELLWECLDQLSPENRRVVVLHYFEGCNYREIAHFLGIRVTTVKMRLYKSRRQLREKIEPLYDIEAFQSGPKQRLRARVLATLPVLNVPTPMLPPLPSIFWRNSLLSISGLAGLALLGSFLWQNHSAFFAQNEIDDRAQSFRVYLSEIPRTIRPQLGQPRWSGAQNQLLIPFTSRKDGTADIFLIKGANASPINLTRNTSIDNSPSLSPNGTKIAFASNRDDHFDIYIMNIDGTGLVNLTQNPAIDSTPTFSPNGTPIAFSSNRDGNQEIYVMDTDGGNLINLTQAAERDWHPVWSPDGQQIAFSSFRDEAYGIYIMDIDGGNVVNLMNGLSGGSTATWTQALVSVTAVKATTWGEVKRSD